MDTNRTTLRPFLRWAGGKQWLSKRLSDIVPDEIGTYYEPFMGGASLFFALLPTPAVLSDINPRLVEAYQVLRDQPSQLIERLAALSNDKTTYYEVRARDYASPTDRAAQFIYLNRTCWNGLHRVNQSGTFNVPFGNHGRAVFSEGHLLEISCALRSTRLQTGDFADIVGGAQRGDFLYFDPPYTIPHTRNGFLRYNENLFTWHDQKRLGQSAVDLASRGCHVVVSNASYEPILEFYPGFDYHVVSRHSLLAADSEYRRATTEFLIYSPHVRVCQVQL